MIVTCKSAALPTLSKWSLVTTSNWHNNKKQDKIWHYTINLGFQKRYKSSNYLSARQFISISRTSNYKRKFAKLQTTCQSDKSQHAAAGIWKNNHYKFPMHLFSDISKSLEWLIHFYDFHCVPLMFHHIQKTHAQMIHILEFINIESINAKHSSALWDLLKCRHMQTFTASNGWICLNSEELLVDLSAPHLQSKEQKSV